MREASRLRRTKDVQRVRRQGSARGDRVYVVSAVESGTPNSRLAVSAPARLGIAVRRNRARRRARAAFGPLLGRLRSPADLLVTVKPGAVDAPFPELVRSAESLLRELGLLERPS